MAVKNAKPASVDGLRLFDKGFAIGRSDIVNDSIHFRFYEEVFEVRGKLRTRRIGDYLVARIRDVRKAANG